MKREKGSDGCLQCPIAGICGGAAMTETEVPDSLRWRAVLLTLVLPLLLLLAGLAGAWMLGASQGVSAIAALLIPSIYYLSFYIYSKILRRKTNCRPSRRHGIDAKTL